jgi:hypothetical protein
MTLLSSRLFQQHRPVSDGRRSQALSLPIRPMILRGVSGADCFDSSVAQHRHPQFTGFPSPGLYVPPTAAARVAVAAGAQLGTFTADVVRRSTR